MGRSYDNSADVIGATMSSPMNLLMLILIFLGVAVAVTILRIAWKLSSEEFHQEKKEEPGEAKESKDSPGSSENP